MKKGYMFYDDKIANSEQKIFSVAFILYDMDGNQIADPVSQLVNPESRIEFWSYQIHNISSVDVVGKPTFADFCVKNNFIDLLQNYIFVAHSAQNADLYHIKKSLAACDIDMPVVSFIDTLTMSVNSYGIAALPSVCEHFGIKLENHHIALNDVIACKDVFYEMAKEVGIPEPTDWIPTERTGKRESRSKRAYNEGLLGYVNGSDETIEHVLERFKLHELRKNPNEVQTLNDVHIVVTGKVPNYENDKIEDALKNIGAIPAGSVSKKTQLLVIGNNAGQKKIDPAIELGVPVITVPELLEIMGR